MKIHSVFKIYAILALIAAALFSPPVYSFAPVVLLAWYLFQLRWPVSNMIGLLTVYFLFLALPVLYVRIIPVIPASLVSLPVLILISQTMEKTVPAMGFIHTRSQRRFGRLAILMIVIDLSVLALSLIITSMVLLSSSLLFLAFFLALGLYVYRKFPLKPVLEQPETRRILAGKEETFSVKLTVNTHSGGVLRLESDNSWIKVSPDLISLKGLGVVIKMKITPSLSGPSAVTLRGWAVDRWGLIQTYFEIVPLKLQVIPRSRYAVWLARKYLAGTKSGALPLLSNFSSLKSTQGLRQGVEFYGTRQYQAGDSLKNIDWKHSVKYDELIVKEFTEFRGTPAVMLVNLTVEDNEESDKLAYNIIAAAITLGQENIPTALAVYNHEKTVLNTSALSASELLARSLQVIRDISIVPSPAKYLANPDAARLRANLARLSRSDSQAAKVLTGLMKWEYQTLKENTKTNPCSKALSMASALIRGQATVVVLSQRNHDAEALALNSYQLSQKGTPVIAV
jgi:hypothetical protein